jgi:hypothetical protein
MTYVHSDADKFTTGTRAAVLAEARGYEYTGATVVRTDLTVTGTTKTRINAVDTTGTKYAFTMSRLEQVGGSGKLVLYGSKAHRAALVRDRRKGAREALKDGLYRAGRVSTTTDVKYVSRDADEVLAEQIKILRDACDLAEKRMNRARHIEAMG